MKPLIELSQLFPLLLNFCIYEQGCITFLRYKTSLIRVGSRGRNNGQSMDITGQIWLHVHPEFSFLKSGTVNFFSWTTGREFVWDTLKELQRVIRDINERLCFLMFRPLVCVYFQLHQLRVCWMISNLLFAIVIMIMHWAHVVRLISTLRSSRSQMFFRIDVLKNFSNFTGKHLCWSTGLQLY